MLPTPQLLLPVSAVWKADTTLVPSPDNGSWHWMPCAHSVLVTWILRANMNAYILRFCSYNIAPSTFILVSHVNAILIITVTEVIILISREKKHRSSRRPKEPFFCIIITHTHRCVRHASYICLKIFWLSNKKQRFFVLFHLIIPFL